MKKLFCFDFDGTLTTNDTLIEFIRYACGTIGLLAGFLLYSPWLVAMKLHLYPNNKAKQMIFAHYFRNMPLADFDILCRSFADASRHLLRPAGLDMLRKALSEGAEVYIVSASIDNWVKPFFVDMANDGDIMVLGTQIEVLDGKLTGRFLTANCYGQEKVNRIMEQLPGRRENYVITAFGDSRGDKEMLDYADQGFFKPFR